MNHIKNANKAIVNLLQTELKGENKVNKIFSFQAGNIASPPYILVHNYKLTNKSQIFTGLYRIDFSIKCKFKRDCEYLNNDDYKNHRSIAACISEIFNDRMIYANGYDRIIFQIISQSLGHDYAKPVWYSNFEMSATMFGER